MKASLAFRLSALMGFAGVAFGAFGAHALSDILERRHRVEVWKTAVLYHLVHAVILLILAMHPRFRAGAWFAFAAGIVIFCGSLYALALGAPDWIGALTPLGGLCFLGGYITLGLQARSWTVAHE